MSDSARAILIAGLLGALILLGPLALVAAGVIGAGTMVVIQGLILLFLYGIAVGIRRQRDRG